MKQAAFHAEQHKALKAVEAGGVDSNAIITGMPLQDGSYHVLSRYGDPVWVLPDSMFSAGTKDTHKKLDFSRIPEPFRETLRFFLARYILVGIEGRTRPQGNTIIHFFRRAGRFLTWLEDQGIGRLSGVTPLVSQQYVTFCRGLRNKKGEPLAGQTLKHRFAALENLHILSQQSDDPMPHPWPESSANHLAGKTGQGHHNQEAKTKVIPDEILGSLFQLAVEWLDRADEIVQLRAQIDAWEAEGLSQRVITTRRIKSLGWTKAEFSAAERHLQSSCMCIILITSGIRVSELCSLENQAAFKRQDDEGEPFHWMRGLTYKTTGGAQPCEWLVSKITHRAIAVAERLAQPLQARLEQRISELWAENPADPDVSRLVEHQERLFLVVWQGAGSRVGTISTGTVITRINALAAERELDWQFAPHQFRRTFAVYAAHSAYGDLRYLRDHFKHWSLDMTLLYAMSRDQDAELYDEIGTAAAGVKREIIEHWMEPDAILAGGAAEPIRAFRTREKDGLVKTKADRKQMVEELSGMVHLRATGVSWCAADEDGCDGGRGAERTRCADCSNAVIDESHKPMWQAIYAQQCELLHLDDLGPGGKARVEKDFRHCVIVLKQLGATDEDLRDVGT